MAKYRIDADTAMGAANQLARAINEEAQKLGDGIAVVRSKHIRDDQERLRVAYTVTWEKGPIDWARWAIEDDDIFEFAGDRWTAEALTGPAIQITPVHRRS